MFDKFISWCKADTAAARLERTIVQGILSAIIVAGPQIIGLIPMMPEWATALAVAVFMAIFSPIMAAIGNKGEIPSQEVK